MVSPLHKFPFTVDVFQGKFFLMILTCLQKRPRHELRWSWKQGRIQFVFGRPFKKSKISGGQRAKSLSTIKKSNFMRIRENRFSGTIHFDTQKKNEIQMGCKESIYIFLLLLNQQLYKHQKRKRLDMRSPQHRDLLLASNKCK